MIIVKLIGGLGNQLFQYALGCYLTEKYHTELKLDISGFDNYKLWKYELDKFNIIEDFANPEELKIPYFKKRNGIKKILFKLLYKPKKMSYIVEKHFHFDSCIINLPDNVYLDGCWQSEKYFKEIQDIIRKDFTFKLPAEGKNKELLEQISSVNSVSLHVRRGDYITNSSANKVHGVCSLDYYNECIKYIVEKVNNPHFFIFSDEPEWVKENLTIPYFITIVDNNDKDKGYEDMRLMSNCKHNIIANSSFSWWGAWLNNNPDKIVIAPQKWFNHSDFDTKDLIPDKWVKI